MLTPEAMAGIARACWPDDPARWTPATIAAQLAAPNAFAVCRAEGFAILRVAGAEAELLSLDVLPAARRRGVGSALLQDALGEAAARGAREVFLEVDVANTAARALYEGAGFVTRGRRPNYYRNADGTRSDALVMALYFGTETGDAALNARPPRG